MPRPLADFHADVLQWLLSGQTQCEMQKEGLDRFHESIMPEVNDGRLLLGVKRMAGVSPASVAHSKVLLYSPWIVAAGCVALPWYLTPDWFWVGIVVAPFVLGTSVEIAKRRLMARARRTAKLSPLGFMRLWDEGALSLKLPQQDIECVSPHGDYRTFMVQHFIGPRLQRYQQAASAPKEDADGWITLGPDARISRLRPGEKL